MSIETVRAYLTRWNRQGDIIELDASTATVPEAAAALGVESGRIAKSISLHNGEGAMLVIAAGDVKLDNKKFKARFGFKPRMLSADEALRFTGHAPGGVCPFALPDGVDVYLDQSLRRFDAVYPACGSGNSAIRLSLDDLAAYSRHKGWVDVCGEREGVLR